MGTIQNGKFLLCLLRCLKTERKTIVYVDEALNGLLNVTDYFLDKHQQQQKRFCNSTTICKN